MNHTLYWEISSVCQLKCKYCFSSHQTINHSNRYVDLQKVEYLVEQIKRDFSEIVITGGEPLLNPNIISIIKCMRSNSIEVRLLTNGILLTKDMISKLNKIGINSIAISLDSINPEINDLLRGKTKVILNNIDNLKYYDKIFKILNCVVTTKNLNCLEEIIHYSQSRNIRLDLIPVEVNSHHCRRNLEDLDLYSCNHREKISLIKTLNKWAFETNLDKIFQRNFIKILKLEVLDNLFCPMGTTRFVLDVMGNIYPCFKKHVNLGNVYSENICEIIDPTVNHKLNALQKETQSAKCFSNQCICFINWDMT